MIRIRCDDVMVESSSFSRERSINRIIQITRWMDKSPQGYFNFIPTILVEEMEHWPEVIDLIRHNTMAHKMSPQIHGFQHIDYASVDKQTIREHLKKCLVWFKDYLNYEPTTWATPWGAWTKEMEEVANEFHLTVETTAVTMPIGSAIDYIKARGVEEFRYSNPTILIHWWEKGLKLLRLTEIVRYGSYKAAQQERPDLFKERI